ncbi:hypothetical protein BDB01DRAFT_785829 [Pilobolus umbonatus]|nr:hypothetical protein BDB01DRAFT_785829 [Pilobolus umbonatus]
MFTSTDNSRDEFIQKARKERDRREYERIEAIEKKKKEDAASVIQRAWKKATASNKEERWVVWHSLMSTDMDILDFYQSIGLYCLFTRDRIDHDRLKMIMKHLTANKFMSTTVNKVPYFTLLIDKRYTKAQQYLQTVITQCIEVSILSDKINMGQELTFLLLYLNPKTYKTKYILNSAYVVDTPDRALQSIGQRLLKESFCRFNLREPLIECIQQLIRLEDRSSKGTNVHQQKINAMKLWLSTITRLALYPIENAELSADSLSMETASLFLWTNVLAAPCITSVINDMTADRLRTWTLGVITAFLLNNTVITTSTLETLSGNGCLFLFANLTDLWNSTKNTLKSEEETQLVELILLFIKFIQPSFSYKQTNVYSSYHAIFKWSKAKWGNSIDVAVFERVMKQIEYIWSRSFMDRILHDIIYFGKPDVNSQNRSNSKNFFSLKKTTSKTTNGGELALFSIQVERIFSLYAQLSNLFLSHRKVIYYRIAFTSSLMPKLWYLMNQFGPKGEMIIYMEAAQKSKTEKEPLIQILKIFCEACSIVFLTLDDADIFTHHKPFSPQDLIQISKFLNSFYFILIQQQTDSPTELPRAAEEFRSARRLLLQIYDLNLHHSFCSADHWLLISMDSKMKTFFSSLFNNNHIKQGSSVGSAVSNQSSASTASLFLSKLKTGDPIPLRILQLMPHTISFDMRLKIFRDWIALDKSTTRIMGNRLVKIRRNHILEDGYRSLCDISPSVWKGNIRVSFINELGADEAGIDQGGPFKDFITTLISEAFEPNFGLFSATKLNKFYPNMASHVHGSNHIQLFEFIGKVIGKSVYEGILLDVQFAEVLLAKLLGRNVFLGELKELDEEVWRNLTFVKRYEGDVEDLCLTFEANENVFGKIESHELKYKGRNTAVTNSNKVEYIYLMADYKLNQREKEQTKAFVRGFREVISENWIKIFSPPELQRVLSGEDKDFDITDLRKHTAYDNGYFDQHPIIRSFWQIIHEFTSEEKRAFLKFSTGCPKPPIGGFDYLQPPFTIRMVPIDSTESVGSISLMKSFFKMNANKAGRLPTSSTCFNLLKLPAYTKKSLLKDKLSYAIHSNTGFELS